MSQEPKPTHADETEVVPPAAAPPTAVPQQQEAAAPPPPHAASAPPPPPPPGPPPWGPWGPRGPYRRRGRGVELLAVGLVGLVLGCVLGAGVTAVAAHFIGDRHGRFDGGGNGWYDRRQGPGFRPNFPRQPNLPQPPAAPTPAPTAS
jgi:hypothetical protein